MEKKPRGRPPKVKPTNWEALSKKLQKALEDEISDSKNLIEELMMVKQQAHDNSVELIKAKGIIEYLETKINELDFELSLRGERGYDSV
jgi:transcriptional regulatory protein LevR